MDDDLEAAWQREKQIAEAREAREKALQDCVETLDMLRSERSERAEQPAPAPEPPKPVRRAAAPPERLVPHPVIDWDKTEVWVRGLANRQIEAFAADFGGAVGSEFKAALDAAKAELRSEFAAAIAEFRIAMLQERLAEAERAVPKPRLIGASDAA